MKSNLPRPWLVTGAAGFLGSHLVEQLLARHTPVIALDNLSWGRLEHLQAAGKNPRLTSVIADIRDYKTLSRILARFQPRVVIHLAALHYIPAAVADPSLTVSINVYGTQVLLAAAIENEVECFWFASTGDVYASSDRSHREDDSLAPFNIYGLSKMHSEQLIGLTARQQPERRYIIGRLFNLYGTRETNPHIIPEILQQLRVHPDGPLRLGNLWPRRELIEVSDAARVIIETVSHAPLGVTTLNVATGTARSMQEVIEMMSTLLRRPLEVETDPSKVRPVERAHLQADVTRLRSLLGWAPPSNLRGGLLELLTKEGFAIQQ